jgi:hypothetical protein
MMLLEERRWGGEVDPRAPLRTVIATAEKDKEKEKERETRKLSLGGKKPRKVADIKLSDNVTISVIPRGKTVEEGDPFRPSRKLQRSPTIGGRVEVEVVEDSEGSYGVRDSDYSTPVVVRRVPPVSQLIRKVMDKNSRKRQARVAMASEVEDSAREDTQPSDVEEEDAMISKTELKGFTQALDGALQMLNVVVRKFKLDKDKDEGIKEIGNLIKGIFSSLEQCGEQKARRRRRRKRVPV